ncbi:MAG TPA: hypothetical protein VMB50_12955 [Myxococcales bacterium]|nr:hypothetical protein [Myxococcales bacterium]
MSQPSSPPRTVFAQQALDLAQLFAMAFAEPIASGKVLYKVEMSTPEGPSTGGGVQGVQHLTLVPQGGGAAIVIGLANRAQKTAEVRTHALLQQMQERRSPGTSFALDPAVYAQLLERLKSFFSNGSMTVSIADATAPASSAEPALPAPGRVPWGLVIGIAAVVLALGLGLGIWLGRAR